ncbi:nucleolar protein dao-5-like isoform X1 [Tachyglossus aculeatus]|uniref:nucleolar protein dao-5-like isoform X1 n=1 Tax=Tachyglossus aculeatus TaxID=9261 RepID=UPI0018F49D6E|nr:nucleolar protein dao-5-like isoform X1 [Tachyglossus aculeatus]XP_038625935.1 nucleolar protein dao-5-like isoform X1 [Tachyglossus aculeatus]XP_038625936.1 nucleolar protein dao-5-like isoform X1 [Tachyglossus aculeatus]
MKREIIMGRNSRTRDRANEADKTMEKEQVTLPEGKEDRSPSPTGASTASTVTRGDSSSKQEPQNHQSNPMMVDKGPNLQAAQKEIEELRPGNGKSKTSDLESRAAKMIKKEQMTFPEGTPETTSTSASISTASALKEPATSSNKEDPLLNCVQAKKSPHFQVGKKINLNKLSYKTYKESNEWQQDPEKNRMLVGKSPDHHGDKKKIRGKRPWGGKSEKSGTESTAAKMVKTKNMAFPEGTPEAKPTSASGSSSSTLTQAGTSSQEKREEAPKKRVMGRKTADPQAVEKLNKLGTNLGNKKEREGKTKDDESVTTESIRLLKDIASSQPNKGSTSSDSTPSSGACSSKKEQDKVTKKSSVARKTPDLQAMKTKLCELMTNVKKRKEKEKEEDKAPKKRVMAHKAPDLQAGKGKLGELMSNDGNKKEKEGARKDKSAGTEPTNLLKNFSSFQPKQGSHTIALTPSLEELSREEIYSDEKVLVIKDNYAPIPNHWLVLAKESISGVEALTKEHVELLKHMQAVGRKLIEDCAASDHFKFRTGFHTLRNIRHVPLHVISQDFISTRLKDKNFFNIKNFLDSEEVIKMLERDEKVITSG